MKGYLFPGQGAQFAGMGKDLYEQNEIAQKLFNAANDILGFSITEIMFGEDEESLRRTDVTQPAIFIHSYIKSVLLGDSFIPEMAAGHSLGEYSALAACGALSFEDALKLVSLRANAMQKACELHPGTMAAILGLADEIVVETCASIDNQVVAANFNCPGQLVISGTNSGVETACRLLLEKGATKAVPLQVGGAFHSPLMKPAEEELGKAIDNVVFSAPSCPVYQNVNAKPTQDIGEITALLKAQLTAPVRWTQTMQQMIADGMSLAVETGGNGSVLRGLLKRIDRNIPTESA